MYKTRLAITALCLFLCSGTSHAEPEHYEANVPEPTFSEVSCGPRRRNILDFWKAKSDKLTCPHEWNQFLSPG
jgi:hypothetical protein